MDKVKIIVDTREQKPLFRGKNTIRRKLDEGDYNIEALEKYIIIERKTLEDLYGSIIKGHIRFADELNRARLKNKKIYVVVEGLKQDFLTKNFPGGYYCKLNPKVLAKIISTMEEKYFINIVWCNNVVVARLMVREILKVNFRLVFGEGLIL